jgi:hypothetical protein
MMVTLGKLVAVPLRSVWPHEAADFTGRRGPLVPPGSTGRAMGSKSPPRLLKFDLFLVYSANSMIVSRSSPDHS